jgi:hypothetical protein
MQAPHFIFLGISALAAAATTTPTAAPTSAPAASITAANAAQTYRVTLSAADFDRAGEIASFKLPAPAPKVFALHDAAGKIVPTQTDDRDNVLFFIPAQKSGEKLSYTFDPAPSTAAPASPGVEVKKEDGRLRFSLNDQTIFYYQMDPAPAPRDGIDPKMLRGAFIEPIFSPAGKRVTDSYPADHVHHHGIWTAWEGTEFEGRKPDFWNTQQANGGTVEFVALDKMWGGVVQGGFVARHRFMDRQTTPATAALNEKWEVAVYAAPGFSARIFDLRMTHTLATDDPLALTKYRYGGLGVRGSAEWLDKTNFTVLTSNGVTDRVQSQAKSTRWFFLGGKVGGAMCGITVLDDPANFRAPQPVWMNADQPFFCYVPVANEGFSITKDKPYTARYRFIIQDGAPDAKFLEACWQGFAHPATAAVEAK